MNTVEIGMLRQWLNEDRIDDPKKMVTNEEIATWLNKKENHYQEFISLQAPWWGF